MARHPQKRLTARGVLHAKPGRHADGGGLYLHVEESGARRWFLRVMVRGRRTDVGLGPADLVPLAEARELALVLRKVARAGGDPHAERDRHKRPSITFEEATREVWRTHVVPNNRNAKHVAQWLSTLERFAFAAIGDRPVAAIEQGEVLRVLAPIWTEVPETARRVKQRLHTVFDWTIAAGHRAAGNPVVGVTRGLPRQRDRAAHFRAMPWGEVPAFMVRLRAAPGMGALALRFAILTAARSGEVRGATWAEIPIDSAAWTVPASRMKSGREHRVPLSAAALAVLETVRPLAEGPQSLVFPSSRAGRALSQATLSAVLGRLKVPVTVHGFRSAFRDWCEETGNWPQAVKEAALAHVLRNKVERAYRRTDLFAKRRELMSAWAEYLGEM